MESERRIYENVRIKQDDTLIDDNKNYELLNICTRDATNQYEQPQVKALEHKPSVENHDRNENNNVIMTRTKIKCLLCVVTFVVIFTLTVTALSVSNTASFRFHQAQVKVDQGVLEEQITNLKAELNATQSQLEVKGNDIKLLNSQLNNLSLLTQASMIESEEVYMGLQNQINNIKLLNSQQQAQVKVDQGVLEEQITNLKAELNATQSQLEVKGNDIKLLNRQLNNLSLLTQASMIESEEVYMGLQNQINKIKLLNSQQQAQVMVDQGVLEEQITNLKAELNATQSQLGNDIKLLNRQLNNLSLLTQASMIKSEEVYMGLQNQINNIKLLNSQQHCGPGLWQRVTYLNMSDPSSQCPSVWKEYSANGVRACGRPASASALSCYSMNYSSSTIFNRVCGQVIGYQVGFAGVFDDQQLPIDTGYVDGVSITYGVPRIHVWTYAAGASDTLINGSERYSCPCLVWGTSFSQQVPPSFVGNDYYCESGNPNRSAELTNVLRYTDDPLWDGQSCEGRCCSDGRAPPWFSVQLAQSTTSNIEVRICGTISASSAETPIEILEIYTQ